LDYTFAIVVIKYQVHVKNFSRN